MNTINIAIADDNHDLANSYADALKLESKFNIVGIAKNGKEAVEIIYNAQPDVLLLDMIMPKLDGFGVLNEMQRTSTQTKVLAISSLPSDSFAGDVVSSGAAFFLSKPTDCSMIIKKIKSITTSANPGYTPIYNPLNQIPKSFLRNYNFESKATEIFLELGIPAHVNGYSYLRAAVSKAASNKKLLDALTKQLYPIIAKEFDTTATRVERSIRHAIEATWDRGDIDMLNKYFGYTIHVNKGKPTNGQFISAITDHLHLEAKRKAISNEQ